MATLLSEPVCEMICKVDASITYYVESKVHTIHTHTHTQHSAYTRKRTCTHAFIACAHPASVEPKMLQFEMTREKKKKACCLVAIFPLHCFVFFDWSLFCNSAVDTQAHTQWVNLSHQQKRPSISIIDFRSYDENSINFLKMWKFAAWKWNAKKQQKQQSKTEASDKQKERDRCIEGRTEASQINPKKNIYKSEWQFSKQIKLKVAMIWEWMSGIYGNHETHITLPSIPLIFYCFVGFSFPQFYFPSDGITLSVYNNISCVCVCFGEGHPISRFNTMTYDAIRMAFQ